MNLSLLSLPTGLYHQRVLIREDFNVPIDDKGLILDDQRIQRALPTLRHLIQDKARVMIISHLGRPTSPNDSRFSLRRVADCLSDKLHQPVTLIKNWQSSDYHPPAPGQIHLWENSRFLKGEIDNDPQLARAMAKQCDLFVMDAFASSHRMHASTYGVIQCAEQVYAGPLLLSEIRSLLRFLNNALSPCLAVIGGSKISTKIRLLQQLLKRIDFLILGGGILNTLLAAKGYEVGKSLVERDAFSQIQDFLASAKIHQVTVPLPLDVVVAKTLAPHAPSRIVAIDAIDKDEHIFDVGPKTQAYFRKMIGDSKCVIWNGPIGVFEVPPFEKGTKAIAQAIADSQVDSLAGGGDTLAALKAFDLTKSMTLTSTGGGAFLALLQDSPLAALDVLSVKKKDHVETY